MKNFLAPLLLMGFVTASCSDKKEDSKPSIPFSTATANVDGQAFASNAAAATATLSRSTNELIITFNADNGGRVVMRLMEFANQPGKFSGSGINAATGIYYTEISNGRALYFDPRRCSASSRFIEILTVDTGQQTVSGIFEGSACGDSNNSRTVNITGGRFHLRYTLQ